MMVKCLEAEKVEVVFGYPGAAICPFYDYLGRSKTIEHVLVRSEQNSAHAASGYARTSQKVGVCVATSGPGATNMITGIATAYMDSIALVVITGQVNKELLGRDVFQEADITGACESFTKHSYLVERAADIPRVFKEAFYIASSGRPGPVLIDIPVDVQQEMEKSFTYPQKAEIAGYKPTTMGHPMQIKKALSAIKKAERPVICCGGGVLLADAREEMTAFAKKSKIPVVATMMGIGVMLNGSLPSGEIKLGDSPVYLGMIGNFGRDYANKAISEADLIVICGARVGDRAIAVPNQIAERATVIHIDIDPVEIGKNMRVDIPIVGDIKNILTEMTEKIEQIKHIEWAEKVLGYKLSYKPKGEARADFVEPRLFIRELSKIMDSNAILTADPGQGQIWAAINYSQKDGRFLTSGGLGTMGYALPAAIGAKIAKPERQVVVVCGDGAFQMSMCELSTVVEMNTAVKIIVFDNSSLGMVREFQDKEYGKRRFGVVMDGNPNFVKLCEAYGIKSALAENNEQANRLADEMLNYNGAYVLVCKVSPETPTL